MKTIGKNKNEARRLLAGAAAGILFFVLCTAATAFILTKNDLSFAVIKYTCLAITAASSFLAGFISKKKNRMKGIVCGAVSSAIVMLLIFILLFAVTKSKIAEETFLLIPAGLPFGILGGIISSNLR